jgi:hypothetical protein
MFSKNGGSSKTMKEAFSTLIQFFIVVAETPTSLPIYSCALNPILLYFSTKAGQNYSSHVNLFIFGIKIGHDHQQKNCKIDGHKPLRNISSGRHPDMGIAQNRGFGCQH